MGRRRRGSSTRLVREEEEEKKGNTAAGRIRPATTAADKNARAARYSRMANAWNEVGRRRSRHAARRDARVGARPTFWGRDKIDIHLRILY